MKYILAIDSFKGCLTSYEAEKAVSEAITDYDNRFQTELIPVSDGGEGMLQAFAGAL